MLKRGLGKNLKTLLRERKLKQWQLAEALHVVPTTISNWVRGHDFPSDKHLKELSDFLGIPVEDLVDEAYRLEKSEMIIKDQQHAYALNAVIDELQKQAARVVEMNAHGSLSSSRSQQRISELEAELAQYKAREKAQGPVLQAWDQANPVLKTIALFLLSGDERHLEPIQSLDVSLVSGLKNLRKVFAKRARPEPGPKE